MKKFEKPEIEVVVLETEAIAGPTGGMGGVSGDVMGGD